MRFHCLGIGSVGSLVASSLRHLPSSPEVRLMVNKRANAKELISTGQEGRSSPLDDGDSMVQKTGSLKIERNGLVRKMDGFEVEVLRPTSSPIPNAFEDPRFRVDTYERNDPIDTLLITTKSSQTLHAIQPLISRLSQRSTIVLLQNGLGVLESLLDQYWPDNTTKARSSSDSGIAPPGRPSFICAITTHGLWRKAPCHFVHAAIGHVKFGVVPNRNVLDAVANAPERPWGDNFNNPILNPRSLASPELEHLPFSDATETLRSAISALLEADLHAEWQPLPILQIAQLQKLASNVAINSLTAILGVHNGAMAHSFKAKEMIAMVAQECSRVFTAHLAKEEGVWSPPPPQPSLNDENEYGSFSSSTGADRVSRVSDPSHPPLPSLPDDHPLSAESLASYTRYLIHRTSANVSSTLADILNTPLGIAEMPNVTWTRTEIDFINGYVSALGRKYGIATPIVDSLGLLVKLREDMLRSGAVDRVIASRVESQKQKSSNPVDEEGLKSRIAPNNPFTSTLTESESTEQETPIDRALASSQSSKQQQRPRRGSVPEDIVSVFTAGRQVFWKGQGEAKRAAKGDENRRVIGGKLQAQSDDIARRRKETLEAQQSDFESDRDRQQ